MFVVRRIEVDYLRPAQLDDSLTVVTEPLAVGGASVTAAPGRARAGRVLRRADGASSPACKPDEGRPGRLPQRWRTAADDDMHAAGERPRQDRG